MLLRLSARSIRRYTSSHSLSASSFCTLPPMSTSHPKNESYLSAVIPKRIKLFEQIQSHQLEKLKSLPHDPIKEEVGDYSDGHRRGDFEGLANSALISSVNDELWDMSRPLEGDCKLELFKFDSDKGRDTLWHSSAHVLGQALEQEYGCQLCIGPCTTRGEGFYYDAFYGDLGLNDNHFLTLKLVLQKLLRKRNHLRGLK
ncbi:hypothetical protein Bca52824_061107 [Brassica carinata]|uniref:TGS domain-containing protein n=1 Tax=Brassica carinata TaxID=52824 RepID=A0A8X7UH53_BRACI|nr:hypothetical protein Bca52824_061107 [Brassica carinata]